MATQDMAWTAHCLWDVVPGLGNCWDGPTACGGASLVAGHPASAHKSAEAAAAERLMHELECSLVGEDDDDDMLAAAAHVVSAPGMASLQESLTGCASPSASQAHDGSSCGGGCSPHVSCATRALTGRSLSPPLYGGWAPAAPPTSAFAGMVPLQQQGAAMWASGAAPGSLMLPTAGSMNSPLPPAYALAHAGMVPASPPSAAAVLAAAAPPAAGTEEAPAAAAAGCGAIELPVAAGGVAKKTSRGSKQHSGAAARRSDSSSRSASEAAAPRRGSRPAAGASGGSSKAPARSSAGSAASGAGGNPAGLVRELQAQVEALAASKAQLRSQLTTMMTSHSDLLSRVGALTSKLQQAVAENAALHKQNLALSGGGGGVPPAAAGGGSSCA